MSVIDNIFRAAKGNGTPASKLNINVKMPNIKVII